MMRITLIICFALLSITASSQQIDTTKKTFENRVYTIDSDDKEMLNAVETAKKTFAEFKEALKSKNPAFKNFTLKKPYASSKGYEHLWLRSVIIHPKKNNYVGIIAEAPLHTDKVKFDEIVEVEENEISDWMYFENNVVKGGFTLRLLRSRMTDEERKSFDKESGYIFE